MDQPAAAGSDDGRRPLCIILEPSRDLAEQTHNCISDFKKYLKSPSLRNELFVGGMDARVQAKTLKDGVDIITGTPGRIVDFMERGVLSMDKVL